MGGGPVHLHTLHIPKATTAKNELRATEAQHWQKKIKNSQPQLKIYWFL